MYLYKYMLIQKMLNLNPLEKLQKVIITKLNTETII
jgi:hypothetical protein